MHAGDIAAGPVLVMAMKDRCLVREPGMLGPHRA
jgi:hypothetical protein